MKCARLHLQERTKGKLNAELSMLNKKPRRYCQRRLLNSQYEEDPRWMFLWEKFCCDKSDEQIQDTLCSVRQQQDMEDLVLTVQTLKFEGYRNQIIRPRTSFKYKTCTGGHKHRMFVKQAITETECSGEDRLSQLTYYYFDDYVNDLFNKDRSRPESGKSIILMKGNSTNYEENNYSTEKDFLSEVNERFSAFKPKIKSLSKNQNEKEEKIKTGDTTETIENTKITYQKSTERKSLTISRNQSPETLQVIRVDVVSNHSSNFTLSTPVNYKEDGSCHEGSIALKNFNVKSNNVDNKYLLTKSVKTLEENLSGGSKVTLLCRTFKLSNRLAKILERPKKEQGKAHNNNNKAYKAMD